jgi:hypothetical protein
MALPSEITIDHTVGDLRQAVNTLSDNVLDKTQNLSDLVDVATARVNLGLEIGVDIPVFLKNNLSATSDPDVTNDVTEGYAVLSIWINQSTNEMFKCLNNAEGAAVWGQTTLELEDLGTAATQNIGTSGSNVPLLDANNNHSGQNTFSHKLRLSGVESYTLESNTDDYPAGNVTTILAVASGVDRDLTGIANGSEGRIITLFNTGAPGGFNIVLKHDLISTAANRFYLPNAADLVVTPGESVILWYDVGASRWRVSGVTGSHDIGNINAILDDINGV